jgi:iron complex outermembrane receptor protein
MKAAPVVVTATRFETSTDTAPVNVTTITADDIARSGASNLSQVLSYQGGVSVSSLFGIAGSGAKVDLGGFGENGAQNTLVLINGRRLNDVDIDGVNLAGIPLDAIERVEIIRGNATVLYGDNAVSGAINIITKNAFDGEQASIKLSAGSFQTQRLSSTLRQRYNNTALLLSIDGIQSNGYRDNNEYENFSLVSEINRENLSWNYGARLNLSREDAGLPGSLDEATFKTKPTTANSQDKAREQRNSLEGFLEGEHFLSEVTVSKKHQEYDSIGYGTEADLSTVSFTPRYRQTYGNHRLVAGFDAYKSNLDTKASPSNARQDIVRDSYAIYITDTMTLNKSTHLDFGLRKQQVKVDIDNMDPFSATNISDSRNDNLTSWDITLSHLHNYGARNYVRAAKSFRFAVLDEMFIYPAPAFSPVINLLEPQTGRHIEIGTRQTFANGLKLDANFFRINLEDEIAFDLGSFNNINLEKTRHEGLNINLRAPINKKLSVQAGYSLRKARFLSGANKDNDIPLVPKSKFTLSGQYQLDKKQQFGLHAVHTGQRYFANDDGNVGKKLAATTLIDANYSHQFNGWKGLIQIQNVSNINTADFALYRFGSYFYYPLPERAVYITFEADM